AASKNAGILLDHWSVIGPFGKTGYGDFFLPFGPENQFQSSYDGWQKTVKWNRFEKIDKTGMVDFDSLIYPTDGIAYAANVVEGKTPGSALLSIYSPADFRVWWNGEPVCEKNHQYLNTRKVSSARVEINKGPNLLVVKTKRFSSWWMRASLQSIKKQPVSFSSRPFKPANFATYYLQPFESHIQQKEIIEPAQTPYLYQIKKEGEPSQWIAKSIFLSEWYSDRSEFNSAREWLQAVIAEKPGFALPRILLGDVSLRLASIRSGSKARYHREAEQAFQKALDLAPRSRGALIGLQSYYLDRDQVDQALDRFDEHMQAYPELLQEGYAGLLHYSYGLLYSRKGFWVESNRKFRQVLDGFVPSYQLYSHLFDQFMQNRDSDHAMQVAKEALSTFPAYVPFLRMATRLPVKQARELNLIDLVDRALEIHPHSLRYAMVIPEIYKKFGKLKTARSFYQTLRERFPNRPQILKQEAKLSFLLEDRDRALELSRAVYQQQPRDMQAFRTLRDVAEKTNFAYQKYDVQLEDIDINKAKKWESSRASVIFLLDIMVMEFHDHGTYDQYIHQAIQIQNQEGMDKWAEVVIPSGGNVEIIHARTITPDGTVWAVSNVQDLNQQQSLSMYGLEPGAIVEYAYLQRTGRDDPGMNVNSGGYYFGSDDDPMLLSKLTMIKPNHLPFHLASHPADLTPEISQEAGKTVYQWEKWMQDGLKPEPFSPHLAQRVPSIEWTTCADWQTLAERLIASKWGREESSPAVREIAETLKQETANQEEYLKRVYEWIRLNIEDASGGSTTADTVVLKAGSSYQKLRLAHHLLHLNGIESHSVIALDNEKDNGFRPMPNIAYPGYTLLLVPRQEGIAERTFLDFSSRFIPFDHLNPRVRKQVAFKIGVPAPYLEPLDPALWEHGLIERHAEFTLQEDRSSQITGFYVYKDTYDQQIREILTNPEVKQRLVDAQLAQDFQGIQIDEHSISNPDNLEIAPRIDFKGSLPDVIKPVGEKNALKISPMFIKADAAKLITDVSREHAIQFDSSPMRDLLRIKIDFSAYLEKSAAIQLPKDLLLLTQFGYYSLFYEWVGKEVWITRSLLIPPQRIDVEDYTYFVEFCRKIDQAEDRDIRIQLSPLLP
ncbi:DUF3857 domain-containing protein, partial [bacterium]|nr:DUF3857 domain-containing protein [bacterium]